MATPDPVPLSEDALAKLQPVRPIPADTPREAPQGVGLCLSGGGYRAMLFHVGAIKRLNDAGRLTELDRISSVSGGSITAATLALHWSRLEWRKGVATNFDTLVTAPVRALAGHTLDVWAVLKGISPFSTISEHIADAYREHLFGDASLRELPGAPAPLFVINATSLESGVLFRFTRAYAADWRVGTINSPDIALADAVTASSAFPPVLSPCELDLRHASWQTVPGNDPKLATEGFRGKVALTDGGVYDNLGLETVWKRCRTVLVSDGCGHIPDEDDPPHDWVRQTLRVLNVIDNQVRGLRKRQAVGSYEAGLREGSYWGVRSDVADYGLTDPIVYPVGEARRLAALKTRLAEPDDRDQQQLINWGYVICDTALRRWIDPVLERPASLPYPLP